MELNTVQIFAPRDGIWETNGVTRCLGPNWPRRQTTVYGVHARSQMRTLVMATWLISGDHICEGESHVLVLAPHLLEEYVDSPDYEKVIIYDEDHEDNKAGEGQKEDITHILHGVDAVLKTASQQKTF